MKKTWPWVIGALLAAWVLFVVNSPKISREEVKPGSPEYEAWLTVLAEDCVDTAMKGDELRSRAEAKRICRAIVIKNLDLYPGLRPPLKSN